MAGFLGMGNFTKPGKGVSKSGKKKKRFFEFFDIYFLKFWKLAQLNLIFILFCIPIITIGPATAAMMKIVREFNMGKPVFLFSDFFDAFKENFKQGFVFSILNAVLIAGCVEGYLYYMVKFYETSKWFIVPVIIVILLGVIIVLANFYLHLIIVTVNLNIFAIIKNSFMFVLIGARTNFLTLVFTALIAVPCFLFLPFSLIVIVPFAFSTIAMIVCFNSFQYIYKYLVKPYFDQSGLPNPYEPEEAVESVFEDVI